MLIAEQLGAGIQLPPSCTRALKSLNLLYNIEATSAKPTHIALRSYKNSTLLSIQDLAPYIQDRYNAPYLVVHRADHIRTLVRQATSLVITINLSG